MDVLEHEHDRPGPGQCLEQPAHGPGGLLDRAGVVPAPIAAATRAAMGSPRARRRARPRGPRPGPGLRSPSPLRAAARRTSPPARASSFRACRSRRKPTRERSSTASRVLPMPGAAEQRDEPHAALVPRPARTRPRARRAPGCARRTACHAIWAGREHRDRSCPGAARRRRGGSARRDGRAARSTPVARISPGAARLRRRPASSTTAPATIEPPLLGVTGDDLTGGDGGSQPLSTQLEGRGDGAQTVVVVREGYAEHREQPVVSEPLGSASVPRGDRGRLVPARSEKGAPRFRVERIAVGPERGHEHGDDLPRLLVCRRPHEGLRPNFGRRQLGRLPQHRAVQLLERLSGLGAELLDERPGGPTPYASSASAGRPERYKASTSWRRSRSRKGCSSTSASSSGTRSAWRPSARSSSMRSSSAATRSSSRCAAAAATGSPSRSARTGPRQSASARRSRSAAAFRFGRARLVHERPEPVEVELAGLDPQAVAGSARLEALAELATQPPDVVLERAGSGRRRVVAPDAVDQPLGRDDAIGIQQEEREHSTTAGPPTAAPVRRPAPRAARGCGNPRDYDRAPKTVRVP